MRKYYFKATKDNMVSGYDAAYRHRMGHNAHPKPDRKSKEPCGVGVHLAKTIHDALHYVSGATEVYLATSTDIIASDSSKVRVGKYEILWRIPQRIIEEYQSKREDLDKEHRSKRDALCKEYQPRRDALSREYQPEREDLSREYQPKREDLDKEYQSKRDALCKEYQPRRDALSREYQSKRDALYRKTLRKILRLCRSRR